MSVEKVLEQIERDFDASVERLVEWLAIPSVSTDPAYAPDCRRAAQWMVDQLSALGFDARLEETGGHPVVLAHHPGPAGYQGPHVLFYGHYDVQPADPLELWDSPPFEPAIVEGPYGRRVVARGAVDDKGQVLTFVEALRAWKQAVGEIPARVTLLIEGEEESGSVNLERFLQSRRDALVGDAAADPCDLVVVSDTGMWDINTPAITYGLRGLCYVEVIVRGPNRDLHSGQYGGSVPNPANELARILAQLHDEKRRIALPGFYDQVIELSEAEREAWRGLNIDESEALVDIGLTEGVGEAGYSLLERQWGRPTCDVNGLKSGYIGEGAKTIVPAQASAKLSFRLVPDQDPDRIEKIFREWIADRTPPGCSVEILSHGNGRPYLMPLDHPFMQAAADSLRRATGKEPAFIRTGGSIPVVENFKRILGLDTLLVGFGLHDDRVHSPNEKFELKCYSIGQRSHAVLLERIAAMKRP